MANAGPVFDTAINQSSYFWQNGHICEVRRKLIYKLFKVEGPVLSLCSNSSSTLIAVQTKDNITIYSPEGLKQCVITDKKVRKVLWHPLAVEDSCLLVLLPDSLLLYTLTATKLLREPIPFNKSSDTNSAANSTTVAIEELFDDAISMTFGSKSTETGQMTVYVCNDDGNIYALCPVLPLYFKQTASDLDDLLSFTVSEEFENTRSTNAGETTSKSRRKTLEKQLQWASKLKSVSKTCEATIANGETVYYLPRCSKEVPTLQGPFIIQPSPSAVIFSPVSEISTISFRDLSFLAIQMESLICFVLVHEPVHTQWTNNSSARYCYSLIQMTTIQSTRPYQQKRLLSSEGPLLFVRDSQSTFALEISPWANVLAEQKAESDLSSLLPTKQSELPASGISSIHCVVSACSVSGDTDHSSVWYVRERSLELFDDRRLIGKDEGIKPRPSSAIYPGISDSKAIRDIKELMAGINLRLNTGAPSIGPISDTVEDLSKMHKVTTALKEEMKKLYAAQVYLYTHIGNQEEGLDGMKFFVNKIKSLLTVVSEKQQPGRFNAAVSRNANLRIRIAKLNERLEDQSRLMPFSAAELALSTQLEKIEANLSSSSGLESWAEELAKKATKITKDMQTQLQSSDCRVQPQSQACNRLLARLEAQGEQLAFLKTQLTELAG